MMDRIQLPHYTLRKHTTSITKLLVIDKDIIELNEELQRKCESTHITNIIPKLISTDEAGNIVLWDLITRRPIGNAVSPSGVAIIDIQLIANKYLVYLSKDYTLRILDWSKFPSDLDYIFEMNVNTLNFANFAASLDSNMETITLCCCNTQDSETIDVYHISISTKRLTRVFNHIDFYPMVKNVLQNMLNKVPDRLGMIMKFKQDLKTKTTFIGFESGIIVGYQIVLDKIVITYLSAAHFPEPVLDLYILSTQQNFQSNVPVVATNKNNDNSDMGILLSSSTNNVVIKHYYSAHVNQTSRGDNNLELITNLQVSNSERLEVKDNKIAHVAAFNQFLIWSTWNGKLFIKNVVKNTVSKYKRSKSNIRPNESSKGSLSGNPTQNNESKYMKISAMEVYQSRLGNSNEIVPLNVMVMNSSRQRRLRQFISRSWCFIGYHDGTISIYEIE
ncbi:Asa1p PWA37_000227 [Arxiozyma heterogenica]|uniref:Asa1p n=1 Tax=Arxiozyma heterogenica TaxID=278026 RepID=UPI002EDFE60F